MGVGNGVADFPCKEIVYEFNSRHLHHKIRVVSSTEEQWAFNPQIRVRSPWRPTIFTPLWTSGEVTRLSTVIREFDSRQGRHNILARLAKW